MPSRILIISAAFPPLRSGGADFAQRLADELFKRGMEVHILTSVEQGKGAPSYVHANIHGWGWQSMKTCLKAVREIRPDVVDIHFTGWVYHDHPMVTFLATAIKRNHPKIRVVTHIESLGGVRRGASKFSTAAVRMLYSIWAGRKYIGFEYGTLLRDSDWLILLSERDRLELANHCPQLIGKSSVIPPPPILPIVASISQDERSRLRLQLGVDDGTTLIGFFGYVYPGKGLETLLAAMADAIKSGVAVKLAVIGDAPEQYVLERARVPNYLEEIQALANTLGLDDSIYWQGYVPADSEAPSKCLRCCDLAVLPFDSGVNLSNSSLSFTAAHGLPIVSTAGAHTLLPFENERNILLCAPKDASAISKAIQTLAKDEGLRKLLAEQSLKLQQRAFSWEQAIVETLKSYAIPPN